MKFSIITPSLNQSNFIKKTIDSVINQRGSFEIEYFVMDGGSTDNTINILKKYEKKLKNNHRVKFYWQSKKDKGQSDAINQGFKRATGDILAFINSDDYYQSNIFQKVADEFIKNQKNLWLTGYSFIVDENNKQIQKPITIYKNFCLNNYNYNTLLILNYISQPSTFFRKEIFTLNGYFSTKLHLCMDYDFWLKIGAKNDPIILEEYISSFRIHKKSKGRNRFIEQFDEDLDVAKKYTRNNLILMFHSLHNKLITSAYKIIK